jgi:hypothetical protein
MNAYLFDVFASIASSVERRLFNEYGAIFATTATPPPRIIFSGADEVRRFQSSLDVRRAPVGAHEIELQSAAMDALLSAVEGIEAKGGRITARAPDSGARSYQDTEGLWLRNVTRGLEHWKSEDRISAQRAQQILESPAVDQVPVILELEQTEELYFGTFFDRSILYSVAAPGASQHLSLLAFDVTEYQDQMVELELARHGWYRTVPNDLPHFTYLGHKQQKLVDEGLELIARQYADTTYKFWVPNVDLLK